MSHPYEQEILANLERADQSLAAAQLLLDQHFLDSATSRAYYAAFYAATAALLQEQETFKTHSSVLSAFHRVFVKSGRIPAEHGKHLNQLFELRGIGDYGETDHNTDAEARAAVRMSEGFIAAVKEMLHRT